MLPSSITLSPCYSERKEKRKLSIDFNDRYEPYHKRQHRIPSSPSAGMIHDNNSSVTRTPVSSFSLGIPSPTGISISAWPASQNGGGNSASVASSLNSSNFLPPPSPAMNSSLSDKIKSSYSNSYFPSYRRRSESTSSVSSVSSGAAGNGAADNLGSSTTESLGSGSLWGVHHSSTSSTGATAGPAQVASPFWQSHHQQQLQQQHNHRQPREFTELGSPSQRPTTLAHTPTSHFPNPSDPGSSSTLSSNTADSSTSITTSRHLSSSNNVQTTPSSSHNPILSPSLPSSITIPVSMLGGTLLRPGSPRIGFSMMSAAMASSPIRQNLHPSSSSSKTPQMLNMSGAKDDFSKMCLK